VVRVLEKLGHTVEFRAEQTCCGQMHFNTGYHPEAASMMRHFLEVFRGAETICVPSASCVAMIRENYPKIAAESGDAVLIHEVAGMLPRVHEFTELLTRLGAADVGSFFPHTVTLHTSCHGLRSLHIGDKPAALLKAVRGLDLVDLPESDQCCGFGGTFSVKNAEVSTAMLSDKTRAILGTRAEVCAGIDNSCLMHIGGALNRQNAGVRCMHIAEILAAGDSGEPS
jgi:L-lactate dehydrogenase complex protein LldE